MNLGLFDKFPYSVPELGTTEGQMGMVVATWRRHNRSDTTDRARDLASLNRGWWHHSPDTTEDLRDGSWFYNNHPKASKNPHSLNPSP